MKEMTICKASDVQRQFWILNQLFPDSSAYNLNLCYKIKGSIDLEILEKSFHEIFKRHDIFRSGFYSLNNELYLQIRQEVYGKIIECISLESKKYSEEETPQDVVAELRKPFHLEDETPVRVKLYCLQNDLFYLTITMHHIISDLRTKDILIEELNRFYNSFLLSDNPVEMPTVKTYMSFCTQMEEYLLKEQSRMIQYWKNEVEKTEPLNFPLDKTRSSPSQHAGDTIPILFNRDETCLIDSFAKESDVTGFVVLLASYAALLHKYSSAINVCIGVPLTNRRIDGFENTAGCFVNVLPIIVEFTHGVSFVELVRTIRKKLLFAHRNQELPFETIAQLYKGSKDTEINPVFQTGYTFGHPVLLNLNNVTVEQKLIPNDNAQLDMFATFWYENGVIHGWLEYDADLFEQDTITRFISNYKHATLAMIKNSTSLIDDVTCIDPSQVLEITGRWNETTQHLSEFNNAQEMIYSIAERIKERTAIRFNDIFLNYGELIDFSNAVFERLSKCGLREGEPVGIFLNRNQWIIISILGIWKAKCCYVPLDPNFPQSRIEYSMNNSGVRFIITESALKNAITNDSYGIICVDKSDFDRSPCINFMGKTPSETAYVMYTSGSTGNPKGVVIPHSALVNFLQSMAINPGIKSEDILVAVTTISFDISILELFLPLICGAQVVIADTDVVRDGKRLSNLIEQVRGTILQATPVTWKLLIESGWKPQRRFKALCGGEAMPYAIMQNLLERCDELWNMYGPTETTVWSACHKCSSEDELVLLGKPIANTEIYILDEKFKVVPVGVWGELFIGGAGLATEYLNLPEMTKKKIILHPFKPDSKEYLYRTGDFCRFRNDGNIEYGWRIDNQVKIRGHRIELGEIEAVLRKYPDISDVAVAVKGQQEQARIIAYIVITTNEMPNNEVLRSFVRLTLPDYMCPAQFIKLDKIPLTPNGKVDKKSLPDPGTHRPVLDRKFVAPSTKYEQLLTDIWKEVLNIDEIGIQDNFFDIGGNSMSIFTVNQKISEKLHSNIPLTRLFQFPTIETLSRFLSPEEQEKENEDQDKVEKRANLKKQALSRKRHVTVKRDDNDGRREYK